MNPILERLKNIQKQDPRHETEGPRDYIFCQRVEDWIQKLTSSPSEALILSAWGHVLYRWAVPRESYPQNTSGYHQWRRAQAQKSAEETNKILIEEKGSDELQKKVRTLILKTTFPQDPESRVLEDATCLVFLETKLEEYISQWDETKTIRILKGTLEKMTPQAIQLALKVPLSPLGKHLVEKTLPLIVF